MITVYTAYTGLDRTLRYKADDVQIDHLGRLVIMLCGTIVAVVQHQTWLYYEVEQTAETQK